ncbi:hypothetical protein PHLCEN_2v5386 [Hermanssonia centrifuga]|uniref:Uncharacterized protein n=1 Tax=Hermanssonia centrifuga TaxID=98765 RepID=A0A2R6P5E8_9APHY|nr:hypothetical protein PHLCEN_2v5386 [Hermanssonia centrifuga]
MRQDSQILALASITPLPLSPSFPGAMELDHWLCFCSVTGPRISFLLWQGLLNQVNPSKTRWNARCGKKHESRFRESNIILHNHRYAFIDSTSENLSLPQQPFPANIMAGF